MNTNARIPHPYGEFYLVLMGTLQVLSIGLIVTFLNIFYSTQFRTKSRWLDILLDRGPKRLVAHSCLWAAILLHIINPWSLWDNPKERLLLCTILFSVNQMPPLRSIFQKKLGCWPSIVAPYMPTNTIASSLRQSFGPPFILYTLASSITHIRDGPWLHWPVVISIVSAFFSILAGVFFRPDNDWAGCTFLVSSINSEPRRRAHGILMMTSSILKMILYFTLKGT